MKENGIMISDHDILLENNVKVQVKTRYVENNDRYLGSLDNLKHTDKIFFTIPEDDVLLTDQNTYVVFVLVSSKNEGMVASIQKASNCNKLIGKMVDKLRGRKQGLQLHVPFLEFDLSLVERCTESTSSGIGKLSEGFSI